MMIFEKLSIWFVVGGLFFIGFGAIVVTAFLTGASPGRRKKKRDQK